MRPSKPLAVLIAGLMFGPVFAAPSQDDLRNLTNGVVSAKSDAVSSFRVTAVREAAMRVGTTAGHASRAGEILNEIEKYGSLLDKLYPFSALITKQGVLPPVISETKALVSVGHQTMKVANRIYRIEQSTKFVAMAPRWREDYLLVGLAGADVVMPHDSLLPRNDEEKVIWKKGVDDGWALGVKQADEILESNFFRLSRDFEGMARYAILLELGLVSEPVVTETATVSAGDDAEVRIGETLYRVSTPTKLVTDQQKWKAAVTPEAPR